MSKYYHNKRLTIAGRNAIAGFLFILPFAIGFMAFMAYPLYQSFRFAFSNVTADPVNARFHMEWLGVENIHHVLFVQPSFTRYMTEEVLQMAALTVPILIFSFFIAVLLNSKFRGRGFVRAVFFLPVILASGVLIGMETNNSLLDLVSEQIQEQNAMRASVTGVLEGILAQVAGAAALGDAIDYVFGMINQLYTIAMASGIQILIFLAGLQGISPSLYEASSIEGATSWENFWKITFPMLSPMILVVVVYTIIDYMMRTDSSAMNLIEITMFRSLLYGQGSAMAWIYFALVAAILAVVSFFISKVVYYE